MRHRDVSGGPVAPHRSVLRPGITWRAGRLAAAGLRVALCQGIGDAFGVWNMPANSRWHCRNLGGQRPPGPAWIAWTMPAGRANRVSVSLAASDSR